MEYRKFGSTYLLRVDKDEEVLAKITELCDREHITLGSVTGLGAAKHVSLGLFDTANKVYHKERLDFPMEITSLVGNITTKDGQTYLHVHINVCDERLQVHGGHLNECVISATGEFVITAVDGQVERRLSDEIGLNLMEFV